MNAIEENIIIKPKHAGGRPNTTKLEKTDNYFNEYYNLTKHNVTCSCGMTISNKCMTRHLKRTIHTKKLEELQAIQAQQ